MVFVFEFSHLFINDSRKSLHNLSIIFLLLIGYLNFEFELIPKFNNKNK